MCDRCSSSTGGLTIMSIKNTEIICISCSAKEKNRLITHPQCEAAMLEISEYANKKASEMKCLRIEINLTEEIANTLQKKAEALNHSRKSYIEFICIQEAKKIKEIKGK